MGKMEESSNERLLTDMTNRVTGCSREAIMMLDCGKPKARWLVWKRWLGTFPTRRCGRTENSNVLIVATYVQLRCLIAVAGVDYVTLTLAPKTPRLRNFITPGSFSHVTLDYVTELQLPWMTSCQIT